LVICVTQLLLLPGAAQSEFSVSSWRWLKFCGASKRLDTSASSFLYPLLHCGVRIWVVPASAQ